MEKTKQHSTDDKASRVEGKAIYVSPYLRIFGCVKQLTQNGTGTGADGGTTAGMTKPSDRNVKQNIVRVGFHPQGMSLYLFDYKPEFHEMAGHGRQFGVMADEVEAVMPEAVVMHPNGYKQVDYAILGIDFSECRVH